MSYPLPHMTFAHRNFSCTIVLLDQLATSVGRAVGLSVEGLVRSSVLAFQFMMSEDKILSCIKTIAYPAYEVYRSKPLL